MQRIIPMILLSILPFYASCQKSSHDLAAKDPLELRDFQIFNIKEQYSIKLDQPVSEVLETLGGEPKKEVIPNESDSKWDFIKYYYPELVIGYVRNWPTVFLIDV